MPIKIDIIDKVITLVGRRHSGKTEIMKHLYHHFKHKFHKVFVVSCSDFNGQWKKEGVPKENVYSSYSEDWMNKLIKRMEVTNHNKTKQDADFKRVLLICDDVSNDVKWHQSKAMRILAGRGRHLGVSFLCSCQFFTQVPPLVRQNSDLIFYGKNNRASAELLQEEFNLNMPKVDFMKMVEDATQSYSFLVVNNCANDTHDINSVYGKYKIDVD